MYTVPVYFHRYIYVPAEVNLQAHACARHYGRRWTCTVVVLVLARLVRCRGHARPALRTNAKRTQSAPRICRTDGRPAGESFWRTAQTFSSYHLAAQLGTPGYSDRRGALAVWLWPRLDAAVAASAAAAWSRSCLALPCLALDSWARPRPSFQTLLLPTTAFQQVRTRILSIPIHHQPAKTGTRARARAARARSLFQRRRRRQPLGSGRAATPRAATHPWTRWLRVAPRLARRNSLPYMSLAIRFGSSRCSLAHSSRCRCSHIHEERGWPRQPLWLAWFVSYSILSLFSSGRFWRGRRPPVHGSPTCPIPYLHCGRG